MIDALNEIIYAKKNFFGFEYENFTPWLQEFTQTHGFTNSSCVTCSDLRKNDFESHIECNKMHTFLLRCEHFHKFFFFLTKIIALLETVHVSMSFLWTIHALYATIYERMVLWTIDTYLFCFYSLKKGPFYLVFSLLLKCFNNLKLLYKVGVLTVVLNLILDRTGSVHIL